MIATPRATPLPLAAIAEAADAAVRAIPPAWPLAATVAVNPYLGQTGLGLADVAALLNRVAGAATTMPRSYYLDRIDRGVIAQEDLSAALAAYPSAERPADVRGLIAEARKAPVKEGPLLRVSDLAKRASGIDWPAFVADRFGAWAAAYFDEGQALWPGARSSSALSAWRAYATHDLTPEIIGLAGFARFVADAPENSLDVLARAAERLGLDRPALQTYFHSLLMSLGGWAHAGRYRLWQAELAGTTDTTLVDLLAIRMIWEHALYAQYETRVETEWREIVARHGAPVVPTRAQTIDAILHEAYERAAHKALAESLKAPVKNREVDRPALQAAFCIDVRSEIFRRSLESLDASIETIGFAGFFGIGTAHRRLASDTVERRLPVLLNPGVSSHAGNDRDQALDRATRVATRSSRAWGRFKFAAVSSFAFVEAMGPVYVLKLLRDALGIKAHRPPSDPAPRFEPELGLTAKAAAAETALKAMSFAGRFGRVVLIVGHGANVTNNPHASALHCGACGGYSGEVNARLLASVLNDPGVRTALGARGIAIPRDTLFVAGLHDTTTDEVTLYSDDNASPEHASDIAQTRRWLAAASALTRTERALRLPGAKRGRDVQFRSRDWAEVRPEWGLAGCRAFIAAPRQRTRGRRYDGRAFLHDYDWTKDTTFGVLELIMTAPVVVASWISLQYYGSTVAPETFGGGNKVLHNVVGGMGVVEGNGGALRAGLPWQSVHDGNAFVHDPLRLSVIIEAPREAMSEILSRHPQVRALFDNRWLALFAMDERGHLAWRYAGDLNWVEMESAAQPMPALKAAS